MEITTQAYIGAIDGFVMVAKLFDWLRIFDNTAFYILLIKKTIIGIIPFMILFVVSIGMSALPHRILKAIELKDQAVWCDEPDRIWGS